MNLDGVQNQLVRKSKQTEYYLVDPDEVESHLDWAKVKYIFLDPTCGLVPYLPFHYFSLKRGQKEKPWCSFMDPERDAYMEQLYQKYLTEKKDNQLDYDRLRIIHFSRARQITPSWYYKGRDNKEIYYTDEQSLTIENAYHQGIQSLEIDVEMKGGNKVKYTIHLKQMKQFASNTPQRTRDISRKNFRIRKLLRVLVGWFWLEDAEKMIWKPYSNEHTRLIEDAYTTNLTHVMITIPAPEGERSYKINLVKMQQCLLEGLQKTKVQRVGPRFDRIEFPPWTIKPYKVPKYWTPPEESIPDEMCATTLSTVPRESEEFRKIEGFMNLSVVENHQTKHGYIPGTRTPPTSFKILDIKRVQSKRLWTDYQNRKKDFFNTNPPLDPEMQTILKEKPIKLGKEAVLDLPTEFYLFYGTISRNIPDIINVGFNSARIMEFITGNSGMFGHGFYFTENSSKSNQYIDCPVCHLGAISSGGYEGRVGKDGMRVKEYPQCNCTPMDVENAGGYIMILARVFLGDPHLCSEYRKEYSTFHYPPFNKDSIWAEAPIKCFDMDPPEDLVGGLKYREFVIYDSFQFYPEYLIYFQRK